MRLLLLLFLLISISNSLKFLAFSTQFARSHANFIAKISDVLVEGGHEVTIVAPAITASFKPLAKKAKVISIPQCEEVKPFDDFATKMAGNMWTMTNSGQMFKAKRAVNSMWGHACLTVLNNHDLMASLKAESFDAAFSESMDICGPVLFHILNITKWAATESIAIRDGGFEVTQIPSNPSYVPALMNGKGENMNFIERAKNTFTFMMSGFMMGNIYDDIESLIKTEIEGLPPIREILASNSLVFVNSEPLVDFPKISAARMIDIGGITTAGQQYGKLNQTWSDILNLRSKTIIISFGSMAKASMMPDNYKDAIIKAIKRFPEVTFVWKYERRDHKISEGVPNLFESTWMPQNDLLHDPRLTAFITHCGQGSTTEAIDAGVPVIVIPVTADQIRNSHQVERNGVGIRLEKTDLGNSDGKLEKAIREILTNNKYRENARKLQKLVTERPFSMREIFVRNMEFLAKHGPLRQLDHHGRHLNFFQYYLIDVILAVVSVVIITLSITLYLFVVIFRKCVQRKAKTE